MSGADWRRATRARLIAARLALDDEERARLGEAITAWLEARWPPGTLGLVAGYWPIRGEYDPRPYLLRAIAAGGAAALPVIGARDAPLLFRAWSLETPMQTGRWDIQHPAFGPSARPDALLIPLVGFDAAGHRLGYGGGFYDRTLARFSPRPLAIGIGYELGRLEKLQPRPHDLSMDAIVTEAGVRETADKGA